jgi:hypothetical protein
VILVSASSRVILAAGMAAWSVSVTEPEMRAEAAPGALGRVPMGVWGSVCWARRWDAAKSRRGKMKRMDRTAGLPGDWNEPIDAASDADECYDHREVRRGSGFAA